MAKKIVKDSQCLVNDLANDCISRKAAIDRAVSIPMFGREVKMVAVSEIERLPSAQPETCEGCKHLGKWENEVEYGYNSPCTGCKRIASDRYER